MSWWGCPLLMSGTAVVAVGVLCVLVAEAVGARDKHASYFVIIHGRWL